jgi:hypothetical protein
MCKNLRLLCIRQIPERHVFRYSDADRIHHERPPVVHADRDSPLILRALQTGARVSISGDDGGGVPRGVW